MTIIARSASGIRLTVFGTWLVLLFLVLPVTMVVPISFTPQRYLSLPGSELSLRHYAALIDDPAWLRSIHDSARGTTASRDGASRDGASPHSSA